MILFQSTRPRGARPDWDELALKNKAVSIHAPAWGATSSATNTCANTARFNPRARVGRDAT